MLPVWQRFMAIRWSSVACIVFSLANWADPLIKGCGACRDPRVGKFVVIGNPGRRRWSFEGVDRSLSQSPLFSSPQDLRPAPVHAAEGGLSLAVTDHLQNSRLSQEQLLQYLTEIFTKLFRHFSGTLTAVICVT
jgi:hypothetical protein